jgi:hypothetical protein
MKSFLQRLSRRGFLKGAAGSSVAAASSASAMAAPGSQDTYKLTREVPVERGFDIVVAGGGPSGAAAAISAARLGAKVLLLEATGCMGGMGTNAYVSNWYSLTDGEHSMIGGLILELIENMVRNGHTSPVAWDALKAGKAFDVVGFDPEALKILFDKLCKDAGVEVRFFTRVIDVDVDRNKRKINGVVTSNVEGYRYIEAKAFVDGTGDAILSDLCGAKCRAAGRDTPNIMPPTLCAMIADMDYEHYKSAQKPAMVEKAIAEGFFTQNDRHIPGLFRSTESTATLNAGHLFHTDALNCRSLSDGMVKGRLLVQEYANFYRKYMKGTENMKVMATGSVLGIRESRRIVGEYELNYDDFRARRHFPDDIAIYCKAVDIHVYDLSDEEYKRYYQEFNSLDRLKKGENYGIPYGILVPKGWTNLWVGGRCTSADIKVNGAIRDQPACSMMGQAAGTAAVQHIRTGQPACDLDTRLLVETLRKAGANLPQAALSKKMTRA